MTLVLYDNPWSGNCYKVRLLLTQLGIAFERREVSVVDRSGREQVLGDLNPARRIPTLVLEDGRPLAESNAIIFHFAEGTPFLPQDAYERAQVLQWLFFEQYSHEPNIAIPRFCALAGIELPESELSWRRRAGEKALQGMERHLAECDWLVGERCSIADIALYAYTHVAHEGGFSLDELPAVRAWLERVAGEPGHIAIDA